MDPFSIAFGVANAASGLLSAFGGYQSQQAETDAANKSLLLQYKAQNRAIEARNLFAANRYRLQVQNYKTQLDNNSTAAARAYQSEQLRLNELFKAERFANQYSGVEQAQAVGEARASSGSGRTADRLKALAAAPFGRDTALRNQQLSSQISASKFRNEDTRFRYKTANQRAFANVAMTPLMETYGPAPVMRQGPSQLGLLAGIGSSVTGGINSAYNLQSILDG